MFAMKALTAWAVLRLLDDAEQKAKRDAEILAWNERAPRLPRSLVIAGWLAVDSSIFFLYCSVITSYFAG